MIYVFFKERKLKATSEELLKKIDYTKLDFIDALGNKFKVKRAFKVKYLGLWGFNLLLKGRQILIDFEFEAEIEKVSLSNFKENILDRIEKKKQFWMSGWDIPQLKDKINGSTTFEEVAILLK